MLRRRAGLTAALAVVGPGVLAGLSDDDPAGITTYSVLGADYGYTLLWVVVLSTVALIVFHELGMRMGVVTGQGLAGLIRDRYGVRLATVGVGALLLANIGTTAAEFAGVAAAFDLVHVTRYVSVPIAALAVSWLVLGASFHRVERVLLLLSTAFAAYIVSAIMAGPDWGAAAHGLVVPSLSSDRSEVIAVTAAVGTTLAPWGLAFIQSFAIDKRLTVDHLRLERVDVVVGALMTGIIGVFVVIASAATLHDQHRSINDAADAAAALEPVAGALASTLFGVALLAAALLAASILPLATAYAVSDVLGYEAALDDSPREAPVFYVTYGVVVVVAVAIVLFPGIPLVPILYGTQALNTVLLLPLLLFVFGICRDRELMGAHALSRWGELTVGTAIVAIAACVVALGAVSLLG